MAVESQSPGKKKKAASKLANDDLSREFRIRKNSTVEKQKMQLDISRKSQERIETMVKMMEASSAP